METKIEIINSILADWDPIEVGKNLAIDEYRGYIPLILHCSSDKKRLMSCLISILTDEMGLDYDLNNPKHYKELQIICEKILQTY
ncbi:MAG: hypothetical protein LUF01_09990 [Bacteroides sp.]|nr:hypothetical protein [Bacteroides sp.]